MRGTPAALSVQMAILFTVTASNAGGVHPHLHIASCASDVYPTKIYYRHPVDTDSYAALLIHYMEKVRGELRSGKKYIRLW